MRDECGIARILSRPAFIDLASQPVDRLTISSQLSLALPTPFFSRSSPQSHVTWLVYNSRLLHTYMMPSNCPATSAKRDDDASKTVTELIHQRLQSSPKDDWGRLFKCWGYDDCGDCHRSKGHCGWCAIVCSHPLHQLVMHSPLGNRELSLTPFNSPRRAFPCLRTLYQKLFLSFHPFATTRYALYHLSALSCVPRG